MPSHYLDDLMQRELQFPKQNFQPIPPPQPQISPVNYDPKAKEGALRQALLTGGLSLLGSMRPTRLPQNPLANIGQAGLAGMGAYNERLDTLLKQQQAQQRTEMGLGRLSPEERELIGAQFVSYDEQGRPLFAYPRRKQGDTYGVVAPGIQTGSAGPGTPKVKGKVPAEATKRIASMKAMLRITDKIARDFDKSFVGPAEGRLGGIAQKTVGVSKIRAKFYANVKDISDMLLRARSGAQINEQEYERLTELVPTRELPDEVFMARLERFQEALNELLVETNAALESGGYINPSRRTVTQPATTQSATQTRPPIESFDGRR